MVNALSWQFMTFQSQGRWKVYSFPSQSLCLVVSNVFKLSCSCDHHVRSRPGPWNEHGSWSPEHVFSGLNIIYPRCRNHNFWWILSKLSTTNPFWNGLEMFAGQKNPEMYIFILRKFSQIICFLWHTKSPFEGNSPLYRKLFPPFGFLWQYK